MKPLKIVLFITLFWGMFTTHATAQIPSERKYDPNGTVLHALESAIHAKYGRHYEVSFHIMDSLIANSTSENITDPYGTLKGCVLFSARATWQSEDSIITGMYRHGRIVWTDYPGTKAAFGGHLIAAKDINNDGEVEILAPELDPERNTGEGSISYLWILSWNGKKGKMINDIDPETRQSILVSTDGWYDLVKIALNGVVAIRGEIDRWQQDFPNLNPTTLPSITYTWDGNKYGFFPSSHQITEDESYPANLMNISLDCSVSKAGELYSYSYICWNGPESKQSVKYIYIGGLEDTSSHSAPAGWKAASSSYVGGRFFYSSSFGIRGTISPGVRLGGFRTESFAPPALVKYYIQGYRHYSRILTDEERRKDILTNSVTGYTLGTMDTSVQIAPLDRLDSLISYKHRSVSLGWLSNDKSRERECERTIRGRGWYRNREDGKSRTWKVDDSWDFDKDWNNGIIGIFDKRLEKAKQALNRGDSVKARRELQIFVMEVDLVYSLGEKSDVRGRKQEARNKKSEVRGQKAVMTSEAYALLKYNAEYLIDRLPTKHRRGR